MSKKNINKIVKILPDSLKNIAGYIRNNFDESGQDTLNSATGTVGILIKLFAQDKLDKYFDSLSKEKLKDFAVDTYLKAALIQAGKSLEVVSALPNEPKSLEALLIDTLSVSKETFTKEKILTIFTPQYHPIIIFVKEKMQKLLVDLEVSNEDIKIFKRNYNEYIEATIIETFGSDDYDKHTKEIEDFLFEANESKLLFDMYQLNKIGFKEGEELRYEETFASWKPVSSFLDKEVDENLIYVSAEEIEEKYQEIEKDLKLVEDLIEDYFKECASDNHCLKHILFAIADFGKGKSVFLKQYASKLAKEYSETKEGYFPIYFNLREFGTYSSDGKYGVLGSYLLDEYGIRIEDEYFQKKKYIFLVDSLDESGELTKSKIDKVVLSIKSIQNIDKEKYRTNRVIITSRPFSDGLENHLKEHEPYTIQNENKDNIPQFISLYGFKEEQFNSWLYHALKHDASFDTIKTTGFAKEIIDSIKKDEPINIHQKLLDEKTLSRTELRRPIFSYMIYQLIINNVDFLEIGKIGVYLSFINLLTKDAKHIDDKHHEINQEEEIRYRNILHSISSLWMLKRQHGEQGVLKKADICRVLDKEDRNESDSVILERYKKEGVTEIQFLSHSYFGEEDNNLHFQHQSFAEILLAEYYLKVFIKYALDKDSDITEARSKLILGEPTEQTILFFKELIKLLKETVSKRATKNIKEKRKLLYPLLASLATEKHNTLYCSAVDLKWFDTVKIDNSSSKINDTLLKNWAINKEELKKIVNFAREIIDSKTTLLMAKTESRNALYDKELTVFQNSQVNDSPTDIDKWLALVVGNLLDTDIDKKRFFNARLENPTQLFNMIRNWNYSNRTSSPKWASEYFRGINTKYDSPINCEGLNLSGLNFSYSKLANISMSEAFLYNVNFNHCFFGSVDLHNTELRASTFDNIEIQDEDSKENIPFLGKFEIGISKLSQYLFIPFQLANLISERGRDERSGYINFGAQKTFLADNKYIGDRLEYEVIFNTLKGLFVLGLKNKYFTIKDIKSWFDYETEEGRKEFEEMIDTLK